MSPNYQKVFRVFHKNYEPIPLDVFKRGTKKAGSETGYKILVSTILSARTRDEVTLEAAKRLFKKAGNVKALSTTKESVIRGLIFPVGFYKTKAKHINLLAKSLLTKYDGEVPNTLTDLISLPGVGRKTANLVLDKAFRIPAIAVDTHVHQISNMLGWVKTDKPDETEKELVKIIPKKYWSSINRLFVSIGRRFNTKKKLEAFLMKEGLLNK